MELMMTEVLSSLSLYCRCFCFCWVNICHTVYGHHLGFQKDSREEGGRVKEGRGGEILPSPSPPPSPVCHSLPPLWCSFLPTPGFLDLTNPIMNIQHSLRKKYTCYAGYSSLSLTLDKTHFRPLGMQRQSAMTTAVDLESTWRYPLTRTITLLLLTWGHICWKNPELYFKHLMKETITFSISCVLLVIPQSSKILDLVRQGNLVVTASIQSIF